MPRRRRNPGNGRKRRIKAADFSDDDFVSTSDSDFTIDLDDEEFEDEAGAVLLLPPPAEAVVEEIGDVGDGQLRKSKPSSRKHRDAKEKSPLIWEVWEKDNEEWVNGFEVEESEYERPLAETMEPSPDIILSLLRFQKEWLAWAFSQESEIRGGILADEMGIGKTIQAISLVLTARSLRPFTTEMHPRHLPHGCGDSVDGGDREVHKEREY